MWSTGVERANEGQTVKESETERVGVGVGVGVGVRLRLLEQLSIGESPWYLVRGTHSRRVSVHAEVTA
jgi:hypothetical protein